MYKSLFDSFFTDLRRKRRKWTGNERTPKSRVNLKDYVCEFKEVACNGFCFYRSLSPEYFGLVCMSISSFLLKAIWWFVLSDSDSLLKPLSPKRLLINTQDANSHRLLAPCFCHPLLPCRVNHSLSFFSCVFRDRQGSPSSPRSSGVSPFTHTWPKAPEGSASILWAAAGRESSCRSTAWPRVDPRTSRQVTWSRTSAEGSLKGREKLKKKENWGEGNVF